MVSRHLEYRADLDGLRAVAILPVLFFHADLTLFRGGFIGVDVFFVLSGFFMARVIMGDLERGSFSFSQFYLRRMRRILPALFSMMAVTAVAAWFLLMPKELMYFADSLRAAALFASNILFESESGYFDIAAEAKPLLHTWSLSIEEQFYIVFPIALFAAHKFARQHLTRIVLVVALLSFCASSWAVFYSPEKAFYLLHFRVWELLAGALVAFAPRPQYTPVVARALSLVGIAGILLAVFLYTADTPFPGAYAALPVLSTALVIHAACKDGLPALLLSNPASVFIGRISYSLYLWHWPLIVFFRYMLGHDLTIANSIQIILLSFAFAYLSWRFIEQPARYGSWASSRTLIFGLSGSAVVAAISFAYVVRDFDGAPMRLPDPVSALYAATYDQGPFFSEDCFADSDGKGQPVSSIHQGRLCPMGAGEKDRTKFLVWGDSHAAAIAPAIDGAARRSGTSGMFVGRASCPPLPDAAFGPPLVVNRCKDFNAAVLELIERERFPFVFLVGYWPKYVHQAELAGEGIFFDPKVVPPLEDWSQPVRASLDATIARFAQQGTRVILVQDVPEMGFDVPEALARARMTGRSIDVAPSLHFTQKRQALARRVLAQSAETSGSLLVDPLKAVCDATRCHAMIDGTVLYRDGNHLSAKGAEFIAPVFDPVFSIIQNDRRSRVIDSMGGT